MNKSLSIVGLGVLALLAVMTFASSTPTFSNIPTLSQTGTSATITVSDNAVETLTPIATSIKDANGKVINFTFAPSPLSLNTTTPITLTINYNVPTGFVFETGVTYSTTLTLGTSTQVISFSPTNEPSGVSSCRVTRTANTDTVNDNLAITVDSTKVLTGYGSDQKWYPLDTIEAKMTVDNNGRNDLRNVIVNWALYDKSRQQVVSNLHEKLSSFSLKSGDSKSLTVDFTLDASSRFKTGNYVLYTWVTATDRDTGNQTCSATNNEATSSNPENMDSFSALDSIDIVVSSDFVVPTNFQVVGTPSCGNTVQVTGTAWNIGDSDETGVYMKVFNTNLGVAQTVNLGDISSFDSTPFSFNVAIPNNVQSGQEYDLTMQIYGDNNNIFVNDDSDKAQVFLPLTISGTCSILPPATVSANLVNTPQPGQEFTVTATITNTDTKTDTFNLALNGYSTWASLESIDKTTVSLAAGQSDDVTIKMKANSDASGTQSFNLVLTQGTETLNQPISVPIQSSSSGSTVTGFFSGFGSNTYLYAIAALNIILVLIIIIVAVRVVRRK